MGHLEEGKSTYLGEGHRKEEDSISRNFTFACAWPGGGPGRPLKGQWAGV